MRRSFLVNEEDESSEGSFKYSEDLLRVSKRSSKCMKGVNDAEWSICTKQPDVTSTFVPLHRTSQFPYEKLTLN